jgi:triphosphoribosyl-dephospho-CoA synthase
MCQVACIWEVMSRKVGNVHPSTSFTSTTVTDFLLSAVALNTPFQDRCGRGVGLAVWSAVEATRELVSQNTNLGIALLMAPLIAASGPHGFRQKVDRVLSELTVEDAVHVFRAIRLANPGGLGNAPEQDVHSEPTVTLLEAMKLAADRDLIARQYANGYADVFDLGVPAFLAGFEKHGCVEAAVIECQLKWMAAFPDSLIARKLGLLAAEDVQRRVQHVLSLGGLDTPEGCRAGVELDAYLRSNGNQLNPGTTADLVAACLFVALRENKVKPSTPFRWNVPDWL